MNPEAYVEMAATEERHWWFRGRRQIVMSTLQRLGLPDHCRILEIGCGTGGNLGMLRQFGSVAAFEIDDGALATARRKAARGDDIRRGKWPAEHPFSGRSFDLICLFDVLEHIAEDRQSLTQLKTCLSNCGRIVLTVPAFSWMWSDHDVALHHQRRYTRTELIAMLESLGFRVERATYFNCWLFPFAAFMRLSCRALGLKGYTGTAMPSVIVNESLFHIFASERRLLRRFNLPFGLSLLVVAWADRVLV